MAADLSLDLHVQHLELSFPPPMSVERLSLVQGPSEADIKTFANRLWASLAELVQMLLGCVAKDDLYDGLLSPN